MRAGVDEILGDLEDNDCNRCADEDAANLAWPMASTTTSMVTGCSTAGSSPVSRTDVASGQFQAIAAGTSAAAVHGPTEAVFILAHSEA